LRDFAYFVVSYRGKGDGIANGPGSLFGGVPARTQASVKYRSSEIKRLQFWHLDRIELIGYSEVFHVDG
jgi:hypothetical protein